MRGRDPSSFEFLPGTESPERNGFADYGIGERINDVDFTFGGVFFPEETMRRDYPDRSGIPVEIRSGETDIPRRLELGRERVVNEMLRPVADRERLLQRQEILRSIMGGGTTADVLRLTEEADQFCEGLLGLFERKALEEPDDGFGDRYQLYEEYLKGNEAVKIQNMQRGETKVVNVGEAVAESFTAIAKGVEGLEKLAKALGDYQHTDLTATAANLRLIAARARQVFASPDSTDNVSQPHPIAMPEMPGYGVNGSRHDENGRYYYEEAHGGPGFGWAATMRERLEDIGSVLKIARRIESEGWQEVTFDDTQPDEYRGGWNVSRPKDGQVSNDSARDRAITVLSAANGSGKTFHMESDLSVRCVAQSVGYAPVEAGNFHLYDSFAYLGRVSSSGGSEQRGAFISEMTRWAAVIDRLGSKPYVYIDEGASTTSPEEQTALLLGMGRHIHSHGGKVMLATHNELVAEAAQSMDGGAVYHFDSAVDPATGSLERRHTMREGVDDSKFIALARARGFPEGVIAVMERYIDGSFVLPACEVARETRRFPAIEQYTEAEREALKLRAGGISYMFPDAAENPLFALFSEDRGIYTSVFADSYIDALLFHSSPLSSQEILERQRTLGAVIENGGYTRLRML